jgi:hypothetical protein
METAFEGHQEMVKRADFENLARWAAFAKGEMEWEMRFCSDQTTRERLGRVVAAMPATR